MKRKLWIILALAVLIAALGCASALADDAGVTEYNLWVGGVRVTSENKNNIPGVTGGVARFDPATNTLTFTNVTGFTGAYKEQYYNYLIFSKIPLTITGKATIQPAGECPNPVRGVYIYNNTVVTISNATLTFANCVNAFHSPYGRNGSLIINNSTISTNGAITSFSDVPLTTMNSGKIEIHCRTGAFYNEAHLTVNGGEVLLSQDESERCIIFLSVNGGIVDLTCGDNCSPIGDVTLHFYSISDNCYFSFPAGRHNSNIHYNELLRLYHHVRIEEGTEPQSYTIVFNGNGKTIEVPSIALWENETMDLIPTPFVSGYLFGGWYLDAACTQPFDATQPITADITLYAKWTELPRYTVSFAMNGHGTQVEAQSVAEGESAVRPATPIDDQYVFDGWFADSALTRSYSFEATPITYDTTIYAKWLKICSVTFVMNGHGEQVAAQTVIENDSVSEPATPVDANNEYQFMGWFADAEFTEAFDFSDPITDHTIIYAKWLKFKSVTFIPNGGTGTMQGLLLPLETAYILPECGFTPPNGAAFKCWGVLGGFNNLQPGDTWIMYTDDTFYPKWDGPFTVTFDPVGGSGTMAAVTVGYGEAYTLPECGFTPPAGKKFEHWNVVIGDTTTLLWPRYTMTVTQNMTLKPEWRTARATFQANGGKGILTPVDMVPDSSGYITLPECSLNPPDGRMFAGWLVGDTVYQPGQRAPIYGDTLIPAQWTTAHYTVTFDKNGGSGSMASFTTQGDTFTLPDCGFTPPAGKQFAYWIVPAAVTNYKLYYPGQTVQINADTTVRATWDNERPSSWTVSFTPDDGTGTMPSITVADSAYLTFPECGFTPPSGKTFEHWTLKTVDGAYMGTYHPGDQAQIYQNYIVWPYYRDLVTHYVNFYDPSNYNILNTQDIVEGGLVSVPEVSVPGYTLHSWYFRYRPDENSDWITIPFDFGQPVEFYLTLEGDPDGTAISVWADLTQNEHHIALTVSDGGTAQLDPAQDTYHYGDVVYINWEMDSGCHYEGITLTPAGGESQTLDYSYFTMPDCDVAVDVRFRRPVIHSGAFGGGLYWSLSEGHLTIGGVGAMPDFTWENEAPWMAWKNEIYGVEIQPGVTAVGKLAFAEISGLGYASIPDTVTRINSMAFYCCNALGGITLPDGLTVLGDSAFQETAISMVDIPAGVRVIGESAFAGCVNLSSVTLHEGLEKIGDSAFGYCESITEISIPQSVVHIDPYAFDSCTSLQRVSGLEQLGSIPDGLFNECVSLTDIGFLPRVAVIPGDAFARCRSLSSIAIPSTVTRIEDWAFDECDSLTAVYYEGSRAMWDAIQIGNYNDGLEHATIHCKFALTFETYDGPEIASVLLDWDEIPVRPDDPKIIGAEFQGWYLEDSLDTVYDFSYPLNADTTLYAEWYSPDPHYTLRLPNMLTTVESEAFAGVKAYAVAVPRGVTSIADDAFPSRMEYVLGFPGTYAETWARTHGMAFIEIDDAWMASH